MSNITPSSAEMQKLLRRVSDTRKLVLTTVVPAIYDAARIKWELEYMRQHYLDDTENLLAYIRTLEKEHRVMREEWQALAEAAEEAGPEFAKMARKARGILSSITIR